MAARILIIDDEPKWIEFVRDHLGIKLEVEVAYDLATAIPMLTEKRYDLILASARRLDVLAAISQKFPKARVAVATARPDTREAINTYRLGAVDYFPKDFRPEALSHKIREAIGVPV